MKGAFGLVVGALCATVIACMSASKTAVNTGGGAPPSARPEQTMVGAPQRPDRPEADQIDALAKQIDDETAQMGLQPIHDSASPVQPMVQGVECHPLGETCKQSCTLSDTICSNASQICEIAKKLDHDKWADQKCSDSTATCNAAHKQCCDCK